MDDIPKKEESPSVPLDRDDIKKMKAAGIPCPPEADTRVYQSSLSLDSSDPKLHTIAFLAAKGLKQIEICNATGFAPETVCALMKTERMQFEIKHLTYKLHGTDANKRFKDILPSAIDALEDVLTDENSKPAVRANAATYLIDRVLGKPKQTVEMEGSMIREMLERLQKEKTIEVAKTADGQQVKEAVVVKPKDPIDQFIAENLR